MTGTDRGVTVALQLSATSTTAEPSGYGVTTRVLKTDGEGLAVLVSTIHDTAWLRSNKGVAIDA
jgi:hypothetical protein